MATFLDISVLGFFGSIFAFLLIFVIVYGLLIFKQPFGEKKNGLYALIAAAFAVLGVTNKGALILVSFMTPWFFVVIFLGFFILFVLFMFGLKPEELTAGRSSEFRIWPIIFAIVILIFGLGAAFGQDTLGDGGSTIVNSTSSEVITDPVSTSGITNTGVTGDPSLTATDDFDTNVWNTIVNPGVLGMALVLLVGAFAMFFLTKEAIE